MAFYTFFDNQHYRMHICIKVDKLLELKTAVDVNRISTQHYMPQSKQTLILTFDIISDLL